MYDTVNLMLRGSDAGTGRSFLEAVPPLLDDGSCTVISTEATVKVTGRLGNLTVTATRDALRVGNGSLCKWYTGDNVGTLGRKGTQEAVGMLSDVLGQPMQRARVTRLDIGANIVMSQPCRCYTCHLGGMDGADRAMYGDALYYIDKGKAKMWELVIYDKTAEASCEAGAAGALARQCNLVRLEWRLLKRVAWQLGREEVTGAMLYDEAFYVEAHKRFEDKCNGIEKFGGGYMGKGIIRNKSEMMNFVMLNYIVQNGTFGVKSRIEAARRAGEITARRARELCNYIDDVAGDKDMYEDLPDELKEWDARLDRAMRYFR